jgi:hypothetical protein
MSKHLQEEEKSAATTITSTDATRHKEEMKIRGDMVIEMAKALVVFDPATVPEFWIKMARETAEARYRDR